MRVRLHRFVIVRVFLKFKESTSKLSVGAAVVLSTLSQNVVSSKTPIGFLCYNIKPKCLDMSLPLV